MSVTDNPDDLSAPLAVELDYISVRSLLMCRNAKAAWLAAEKGSHEADCFEFTYQQMCTSLFGHLDRQVTALEKGNS